MNELVDQVHDTYRHYPFLSWLTMVGAALAVSIVIKVVLTTISTRLRLYASRTSSTWDDVGLNIIDGLKTWVLFFWAFYLLTKSLEPSEFARKILLLSLVLSTGVQVVIWGLYVISRWRVTVLERRIEHDPSSAAALGLLSTIIQGVFIAIVVLIGLSNLGINISALVAGLGVGGIAVALAAQNVLGDLLASLSIVLDKPFIVGDFIATGKELGTVEHVGIKTTRIRSLSGEELIISNKDLLESRIQNYKTMAQRRIMQKIGVTYSSPIEKLDQIPQWIRQFISEEPNLKFDRCHFSGLGASSLDFEFVFFVLSGEYNLYMDLQQALFLKIMRKFAEEKIEFAFPTQTLFIEKLPVITPGSKPQIS